MQQVKQIEDFPGYLVDIDGTIYTERTGLKRRTSQTPGGPIKVTLYRDGVPYTRSVALLVAKAHLYNDFDPELFDTPIHLDNNPKNNHVDNLAWRPRWFAIMYQRQYWTAEYRFAKTRIEDVKAGVVYDSLMDVCQKFGLLYIDVIKSCTTGEEVFPTRKIFSFV
jgi:hypothetical protein